MNILSTFSGFSTDDISSSKSFYTEVVGLKLKNEDMGLAFELPNGGELFIYEKADHKPASFTVLNFVVKDIEQAVKELKDKGVTFEQYDFGPNNGHTDEMDIMRGKSAGMGPDIAWFKDPSGNILAVVEN
jgi:catechol 2,3-dioxygenase-like lactoylglutathione lyase family enzyme